MKQHETKANNYELRTDGYEIKNLNFVRGKLWK